MIPSVGYTFNTVHYTASGSRNTTNNMVQSYLDDTTLRLMGMLMTISLGIFTILFLYVLYNMTVNVAGTTIAMLFFISLAFFIVLMKTFKLLGKFISHSQSTSEHDSTQSRISTISEIITQTRVRHDSAPPPYEEAVKNSCQSNPAPSNTINVPLITELTNYAATSTSSRSASPPAASSQTNFMDCSRCVSTAVQIPVE